MTPTYKAIKPTDSLSTPSAVFNSLVRSYIAVLAPEAIVRTFYTSNTNDRLLYVDVRYRNTTTTGSYVIPERLFMRRPLGLLLQDVRDLIERSIERG